MKKNHLLVVLTVLLLMPVFLFAGGDTEDPEVMGPVTFWSEVNIKAPQTNLDEGFAKAVVGIEEAMGTELIVVTIPYKEIDAKVNLAVQAGGDVPDVTQVKVQKLAFHIDNGTLMDITEYVEASPWYDGINKTALDAGRGNDGKIYAVPFNTRSTLMYSYTAAFPDGPPLTTDDVLAAGERLKAKGMFTITGKASEQQGVQVWWWPLIKTFGGVFADADGNIAWANDATVKAIEFTREILAKGYAPEVILAPGFDDEIPFMNGDVGAFNAGSWSYVWLNPLKAPSGNVYDFKSASVEEAIKAGDLVLSPHISAPGSDPVAPLDGISWAIPVGSKNVKGAQAFIDFLMQPKVDTDLAFAWGGVPTMEEGKKDPRYADSVYWSQVVEYMTKYSQPMEPIANYDEATIKFADVAAELVQNPSKEIMPELLKAQKEINAR
jgi:multiple sugar transport system substrate-binding protein